MSVTNGNIAQSSSSSDRSRWIALVVLCAGMLMIVLDATIVNVALPKIQTDLGFSQSSLAWVVNAYLISFGGLLLLAGRLGDLLGRRDVFLTGLALFTAASLACGLADSQSVLVVARFIQGIGGALTSAVILGMIVTMFPERGEQAKAIGVYSFVASAGGSIGLLAGGAITQAINWHWIFIVNLPIALVTGVLSLRFLSRDRGLGISQGADLPGATFIVAAVMMGVYAIVEATNYGWGSAHTLGFGAGAVALLVAFVVREQRAANPLVPLRIFRSRNLSGRQRDPGTDGRRDLRDVLPRRPVPAESARLRLARGRPRLHPDDGDHRHPLARLLGQTEHALRGAGDAAAGPGLGRRGSAATCRRSPPTAATGPKCCRRWCWSGSARGSRSPRS